MSESRHTPGPWRSRGSKNNDGDIWVDCDAFANKGKGRCLGGTVATVHSRGTGAGSLEANARLIASAPALLEMVEKDRVRLARLREKLANWNTMSGTQQAEVMLWLNGWEHETNAALAASKGGA